MAWIKYPYTLFPTRNGSFLSKPLLEIEISANGITNKQRAIVDSGADMTMMRADIAEVLDIDKSKCNITKVGGISGPPVDCFVCDVNIKVEHFDEPFTASVLFVPNLNVNVLLGQDDFFKNFRVKFEKDHNTFEISRAPKK